ncbi:MAG: iron-sulfur cluster assembly scaffold protein [Pyrinomonadaceae bacterium]
MSIYPPGVQEKLDSLRNDRVLENPGAAGKDASFLCGSYVTFSIQVDKDVVTDAAFATSGCGYMIATADRLASYVKGRRLAHLHGLDISLRETETELGSLEESRRQCVDCCLRAVKNAFAAHRALRVQEFGGEKALICTCFGVTEDVIELQIRKISAPTVEEVTQVCNAGGGCGSCRMLIQELIDSVAPG